MFSSTSLEGSTAFTNYNLTFNKDIHSVGSLKLCGTADDRGQITGEMQYYGLLLYCLKLKCENNIERYFHSGTV